MPGELGDEVMQQGSGYYERRYVQTGEWNDPPIEPKKKPRSDTVMSVIKKFQKDE